jgi:hypothetical protein
MVVGLSVDSLTSWLLSAVVLGQLLPGVMARGHYWPPRRSTSFPCRSSAGFEANKDMWSGCTRLRARSLCQLLLEPTKTMTAMVVFAPLP